MNYKTYLQEIEKQEHCQANVNFFGVSAGQPEAENCEHAKKYARSYYCISVEQGPSFYVNAQSNLLMRRKIFWQEFWH